MSIHTTSQYISMPLVYVFYIIMRRSQLLHAEIYFVNYSPYPVSEELNLYSQLFPIDWHIHFMWCLANSCNNFCFLDIYFHSILVSVPFWPVFESCPADFGMIFLTQRASIFNTFRFSIVSVITGILDELIL